MNEFIKISVMRFKFFQVNKGLEKGFLRLSTITKNKEKERVS
jgi:hypothetical protein